MRKRSVAVAVCALLVIGLLVPTGASARRVTAAGSIEITGTTQNLSNQLVATLITANPGLEKTIIQQLPQNGPLYVAPFFVNQEVGNPGQGDLFTILVLTNATAQVLGITLTLYNLNGSIAANVTPPALAPHETRVIDIGALLP